MQHTQARTAFTLNSSLTCLQLRVKSSWPSAVVKPEMQKNIGPLEIVNGINSCPPIVFQSGNGERRLRHLVNYVWKEVMPELSFSRRVRNEGRFKVFRCLASSRVVFMYVCNAATRLQVHCWWLWVNSKSHSTSLCSQFRNYSTYGAIDYPI